MKLTSKLAKKLHCSEHGLVVVEKIVVLALLGVTMFHGMYFLDSCCGIPCDNHSSVTTLEGLPD
jgi:hypothetical protein